jgi:hypothetical protein
MTLLRRHLLAAAAALALLPLAARADGFLIEDGLALQGHDPVAYFTEGAPRAGDPAISLDWAGARWQFASPENRAAFEADPSAYAPQYGGYCAWAAAEGSLAPIDPDAWTIVEGKLYLNYSRSVQRRWEGDIPGNISRADANWPRIAP